MFSYKNIILLIVLHFSGLSCQFLNCNWIKSLDCVHYTPGITCGSNGHDYPNRCSLAKAQCSDSTIRTIGEGSCSNYALKTTKTITATITRRLTSTPTRHTVASTKPTTDSFTFTTRPSFTAITHTVATTKPTSDPLRVICDSMSHVHCANDIEPVCGSDDRTYVNTCEFHMEVCQRHDLTIKHIGFC